MSVHTEESSVTDKTQESEIEMKQPEVRIGPVNAEFEGKSSGISNRQKAVIYANLYSIIASVYYAFAKEATMHQDIHVLDLVFIRVCINFIGSWGTVRYSGKHIINDVPKKYWKLLLVRCMIGTLGFTCLVYSIKTIPLFIVTIIFNTAPFITSVL